MNEEEEDAEQMMENKSLQLEPTLVPSTLEEEIEPTQKVESEKENCADDEEESERKMEISAESDDEVESCGGERGEKEEEEEEKRGGEVRSGKWLEESAEEDSDGENGGESSGKRSTAGGESDQDDEMDDVERQLREFEESEAQVSQESIAVDEEDGSEDEAEKKDAEEMSNEKDEVKEIDPFVQKVAHCPGKCMISYSGSSKGEEIVTAGGDGLIKVFKARGASMVKEIEHSEEITAMCAHPTNSLILIGDSSGVVQVVDTSSSSFQQILCRQPGPIRSVSVSPDGKLVAVGTSEHVIRIESLDGSVAKVELKGHRSPLRSVAWDPLMEFLISSSCDGSIKVWQISSEKCVHTFDSFLSSNTMEMIEENQVGSISWTTDGAMFALPNKATVNVYKRLEWGTPEFSLNIDDNLEEFNVAKWSPNGRYLACSKVIASALYIWDISTKKVVCNLADREDSDMQFPMQAIEWGPEKNEVSSISMNGDLCIWRKVIPQDMPSPYGTAVDQEINGTDDKDKKDITTNSLLVSDDLDDDDDMIGIIDEDEEEEEKKNQSKPSINLEQIDTRVKSLIEERLGQKPTRQRAFQTGSSNSREERKFLAWNSTGCIIVRTEDEYNSVEIEFANSKNRTVRFTDHFGFDMAALSDTGAIFATKGSFVLEDTPFAVALAAERPSENNTSIDDEDWDPVEAEHSKLSIGDKPDTEPQGSALLAAMQAAEMQEEYGVNVKVDATDDLDDSTIAKSQGEMYGEPSTVFFRPFESWAHNSEWSVRLPAKEKARSVAAGTSFCAVATNRRIVRIFRPSGLQEAPIVIAGPVVSLAAASTLLLVAFHSSEPAENGTQHISYTLYDIGSEDKSGGGISAVLHTGRIPLPVREREPLRWIGFSDKTMGYMPFVLDSKGSLLGLSKAMQWNWVPLLDVAGYQMKKSVKLWPVSVQMQKLMAVPLKRNQDAPETYPRPVLSSIDLEIPLIGIHESTGALKYQLEETALKSNLVLEQLRWGAKNLEIEVENQKLLEEEAQLDAKILKHIILAVRLQKSARAFGLVRRLRLVKSIQIALIQVQRANGESALIERIERHHKRREKQEELEAEALEDSDDSSSSSGSDSSGDEEEDEANETKRGRPTQSLKQQPKLRPSPSKTLRNDSSKTQAVNRGRKRLSVGDAEHLSAVNAAESQMDGDSFDEQEPKASQRTTLALSDEEEDEDVAVSTAKPKNQSSVLAAPAKFNPFAVKSQPVNSSASKKKKAASSGLMHSFVRTSMEPPSKIKRTKY